MSTRKRLPLVLAAWAALAGCQGPDAPALDPTVQSSTQAEQAKRIADAQAAARDGVIADLYDEWQAEYRVYQRQLTDAEAARSSHTGASASSPVRSLEELLRQVDPAANDPALRGPVDRWQLTCEDFGRRLRELRNDPSSDPRSPLVEGPGADE